MSALRAFPAHAENVLQEAGRSEALSARGEPPSAEFLGICLPLLMTAPLGTARPCGISDASTRVLSTGDAHPLAHLADSCPACGTEGKPASILHDPRLGPSGRLADAPGAARQAAGHPFATSSRGFLIVLLGYW